MKFATFLSPATRRRRVLLVTLLLAAALTGTAIWQRATVDSSLAATVDKGMLTARLTTTGTLRPVESITYRSPLAGRDVEIVELVPEGIRVKQGALLARLDTSELQRDVERVRQELRQSQMDLQIAEIEREEAEAAVEGVSQGEGALTVEEARTRLQLAERTAGRLREEYAQLSPLMEKGVITRDELKKTLDELERAEEELALARKRRNVVVQVTHPRDAQRATLQLAQRNSQLENARARVNEAQVRLKQLLELVERCSLYARRPGLVVYEEFLSATPRRKIRIGDRVTGSQGLITIPEVDRMLVDSSVGEAEVHRIQPRQTAVIRVEAFPNLRLTGRVLRVGTLARSSIERLFDEKRFDLVIELDPTTAELRPEMTVRADVDVGMRSGVLLVPVNAVFEREGGFVVHVVGPTGIETRSIELGESNDRFVEVVAGLRERERVMLTEPGTPAAAGPEFSRPNALQPR